MPSEPIDTAAGRRHARAARVVGSRRRSGAARRGAPADGRQRRTNRPVDIEALRTSGLRRRTPTMPLPPPIAHASPAQELWYLRTYFYENEELVYLDEGPLDWFLVNVLLSDIGMDASIPRGIGRVKVERAVPIRA